MKCFFCKNDLKKGSGLLFARKDGTLLYFCSNKCKRYFEMNKKNWKYKWVKK